MTKPALHSMRSYSQKVVWEADQSYMASIRLQEVYEHLPEENALYINLDASDQDDVCLVVDAASSGARVKVSGRYVYLALGVLTAEEAHHCFRVIHTQLLKGCWYTLPEQTISQYWAAADEMLDSGERPATAESVQTLRSQFIEKVIRQHCPSSTSAMEIGCHNGAHLSHLQQNMGLMVSGVEINAFAVASLFQRYPNLKQSDIRVGDVKNVLARFPEASCDVVYSLSTLAHLHPSTSESVWKDLVRVAGQHIITVEQESEVSDRQWARDYLTIFSNAGARQIHMQSLDKEPGLEGYTLRVFEVAQAPAEDASQPSDMPLETEIVE